MDLREKYARVSEASHILNVTPVWVVRLIEAGKLAADRGPHGWLIHWHDLNRLAADRRDNPPRPGRKPRGEAAHVNQ